MTAATGSVEPGATTGAASETTAGAPASANGPGTASTTPSSPVGQTPADYLARVRQDPSFAAQEVTGHQSRADKAEAERHKTQEWMGQLGSYRDTFSGDQLAAHLSNYDRVLQNPELRQSIQQFLQTGQATKPKTDDASGDEDDEYQSPEQQEIATLRALLAQVDSRVATQEAGSGAQALQRHLESFFVDWPVPPDVAERVKAKLTQDIGAWGRQGSVGRQALAVLQGPSGAAQVSAMALPVLNLDERKQAVENAALRRKQGLSSLSTGVPSAGASTGNEPPPRFASALEALQFAEQNPDKHDSW